jgi:transposase-like protein
LAVALLLAGGKSIVAAARQLGVGERTIRRWLDTEAFRREVDRQRAALWEHVVAKMAGSTDAALDTLRELLGDADSRVRSVSAHRLVIDNLAVQNAVDVAKRLERLERRAELADADRDGEPDPYARGLSLPRSTIGP